MFIDPFITNTIIQQSASLWPDSDVHYIQDHISCTYPAPIKSVVLFKGCHESTHHPTRKTECVVKEILNRRQLLWSTRSTQKVSLLLPSSPITTPKSYLFANYTSSNGVWTACLIPMGAIQKLNLDLQPAELMSMSCSSLFIQLMQKRKTEVSD